MTDLPPEDVVEPENIEDDDADRERPSDAELLRDDLDELAGDLLASQGSVVSTGHPAVDEVLRTLDSLDGLPVDEHVAVFEGAHEQLRRTLSGAGDDEV